MRNRLVLKLWRDFSEHGSTDLYLPPSSSDALRCPSNRLFRQGKKEALTSYTHVFPVGFSAHRLHPFNQFPINKMQAQERTRTHRKVCIPIRDGSGVILLLAEFNHHAKTPSLDSKLPCLSLHYRLTSNKQINTTS